MDSNINQISRFLGQYFELLYVPYHNTVICTKLNSKLSCAKTSWPWSKSRNLFTRVSSPFSFDTCNLSHSWTMSYLTFDCLKLIGNHLSGYCTFNCCDSKLPSFLAVIFRLFKLQSPLLGTL